MEYTGRFRLDTPQIWQKYEIISPSERLAFLQYQINSSLLEVVMGMFMSIGRVKNYVFCFQILIIVRQFSTKIRSVVCKMNAVRSRLGYIIECQADNSFIVTLQCLDQLSLLDVPQFDCHIRAACNKIGRITGKLAVPYPLQVSLKGLVLGYLELAVIHVDLKQFDLFISRASSQEFVVGRELYFEYVVVMCLDDLLVGLGHVFSIAIDQPLIISDRHPLQGFADGDGSDAVVYFNLHHFLTVGQVPPLHDAHFVSSHYGSLSRMEGCAVDGLVVLEGSEAVACPDVEQPQISVLAARVYDIFLLPKASH